MNTWKVLLSSIFFCLVFLTATQAETLKVLVSPFPPLVIQDKELEGYDIDLWKAIANKLNLEYEFVQVRFENIFEKLQKSEADAAIAGITINSEREKIVDFSHHYMDSGLRILVPNRVNTSLWKTVKSIVDAETIKVTLGFILFTFILANIAWWAERGRDSINDRYFPGIFEAIYWCIVTSSTVGYGDIVPRKWIGRVVTVFLIFSGIIFFGIVVGQISSALTVNALESDIRNARDLRGKKVATVKDTTSVKSLEKLNARVIEVVKIQDAYDLLLKDKVHAVVFDSPVLLQYANNEGKGKVITVGEVFDKQYYGIALPHGSPLREKINQTLLQILSGSESQSIYKKWFN